MSLVVVASVSPKGITVVDSQMVLVPILGGGLITLNFTSPDHMMIAAEAMAFTASMATPLVVLVPETPTNADNEVVVVDDTPPPTPSDHNNNSNNIDSSGASRDMLASSDEDEEEDVEEANDAFEQEGLLEGVRRINIDTSKDDSFEDTYGLSQELW